VVAAFVIQSSGSPSGWAWPVAAALVTRTVNAAGTPHIVTLRQPSTQWWRAWSCSP